MKYDQEHIKVVSQQCSRGAVNKLIFQSAAECYVKIWQEPPWCEDFWKPEEVLREIEAQMARPGALGAFAFETPLPTDARSQASPSVIGFSWGYPIELEQLVEISGLSGNDWRLLGECVAGRSIFYLDELGVTSQYRRRRIGKRLSSLVVINALAAGASAIVLRTNVKATAALGLYQKLGFRMTGLRDAAYPDREYLVYQGGLLSVVNDKN